MKRHKSVDDYINAAESWQAELRQLRDILNDTQLTEAVKWGAPCYTYDGKNVVGMCSFKSYVGLWFHQGALLKDDNKVLVNAQEGVTKALRQWRMTSVNDIEPATIERYVKEAIQLIKDGKSVGPAKKKPVVVPPELSNALHKDNAANEKFAELTPGRQREYADYISSAKREATKLGRIDKILPMIRSGNGLNDKYRC
jgi:uncharacterized protein YdeI (YjbR/CyaY-like superfamily)